jgi:cardiolipin synthase
LMFSAFIALSVIGVTPLWLTGLVVGRDLCIIAAIFVARILALPLRVEPLPIGKACTVVQVVYVAIVVSMLAFQIAEPRSLRVTAWITAGFTVASALAYAGLWLKAFSARYRRAI